MRCLRPLLDPEEAFASRRSFVRSAATSACAATPRLLPSAPHPCRGFSIGQRLVDEFLAKSKTQRCSDFREAAEKVAKAGFRMFLNTTATVTNWNAEGTECSLVRGNPGEPVQPGTPRVAACELQVERQLSGGMRAERAPLPGSLAEPPCFGQPAQQDCGGVAALYGLPKPRPHLASHPCHWLRLAGCVSAAMSHAPSRPPQQLPPPPCSAPQPRCRPLRCPVPPPSPPALSRSWRTTR